MSNYKYYVKYQYMPEGPEIRKMVKSVQKYRNARLKDIKILSGRYIRHGKPKLFNKFRGVLPLKIVKIANKGKFVWLELEKGWSIWISMAMTGNFSSQHNNYSRFEFNTSKGIFYLNDTRNFASVIFCHNVELLKKKLASLGPDLLQSNPSVNYLCERIKKSKSKKDISTFLLDQSVLSGVGNYIRADSLYLAKISPFRKIHSLNSSDCRRLQKMIKKVMVINYQSISKSKNKYKKFYVYHRVHTDKGEKVNSKLYKGRTIYWTTTQC